MRYLLSILLALLVSVSANASVVVDRLVAVVNDDVITLYDLKIAAKLIPGVPLEKILNDIISEKLLDQEIKKSKIEVSDDELALAIRRVLMQNHMTVDQFHKEVRKQGMTYEEYTQKLRQQLARQKFINRTVGSQVKITDRDLRDFYDQNRKIFTGTFENERDNVYQAVYDERLPEALDAYLARQKRTAFIEIKDEALDPDSR